MLQNHTKSRNTISTISQHDKIVAGIHPDILSGIFMESGCLPKHAIKLTLRILWALQASNQSNSNVIQ